MCIAGLPFLVLYRAAPAAAAALMAERAHLRQAGGPKFPLLPLATARVQPNPGALQQGSPHVLLAGCSCRPEALLCKAAALIRLRHDHPLPITHKHGS